jgi:hypothetical protein
MYTARQIIALLESCGAKVLLRQLRTLKLRHKTRSEYQVWEEGSKPKQTRDDTTMLQKLGFGELLVRGHDVLDGVPDLAHAIHAEGCGSWQAW